MQINSNYLPQITKVFSKKTIKEILSTGKSELLNKIIINSKIDISLNTTYTNLYDAFYKILVEKYQNEYIYKNEFLLQLLKKNYKTNHVFLQETSIYNNIVDLLVINGKTTAYEIKTEYDSLQRLHSQLCAYSKVFDNIFVITSKKHLTKVEEFLEKDYSYVGILIFSNRTIKQHKKAIKNPFVTINAFKGLLNFTELKKHNITLDKLKNMNEQKALKICRDILKARQKNGTSVINDIPDSIKSLISNIHLVDWQKKKIINKLSKNVIL